METKHTPGPWRYESTSGSNYARIFLSADEGDGDNLRGYCGEANARLIAAAPELLAAIQAMMYAGGKDEFQAAFDNAKHLVNTLTPAVSRRTPQADGRLDQRVMRHLLRIEKC